MSQRDQEPLYRAGSFDASNEEPKPEALPYIVLVILEFYSATCRLFGRDNKGGVPDR